MPIDPGDVALCLAPDESNAPAEAGSRPMSAPIVQTSLFAFPTFAALIDGLDAEHERPVYSRGRNPTVAAAERKLAALERGEACTCFGSGMAAISAVMMGLLEAGDHVLFVNHVYGPTLQLAEHLTRFGIEHDVVLDGDLGSVESALRPQTALVWLESPGTMLFRTVDVAGIAALARSRHVLTCMDNSWATPLFQKPLEAGVDVVVHSATKYLTGHSDVVAGAVITTAERLERIFYRAYLLNGGILAPFDAWLLLRGLRTLPARMEKHETDALRVARFLADHPGVSRVHHPGLEGQANVAAAGAGVDGAGGGAEGAGAAAGAGKSGVTADEGELTGTSGLFSFELATPTFEAVTTVIDALERFRIGVSWGGVESLVISPERGDDGARLSARGLPRGVIRLSIGLEGPDLLIADLEQALARVR